MFLGAAHLPLPKPNINTDFSLWVKCLVWGGVGGHFPSNETSITGSKDKFMMFIEATCSNHSQQREMVMKPGKHQRSKQRGQGLCWKVHDRAHLLFCTHTLFMSYVIIRFLLVSCMNTRNLLLYFCQVLCTGNPQNSEQKT